MSDTKTYRVKGIAIKHDDVLYAEGDPIELSDEEAKPLLRWLDAQTPKKTTEKKEPQS